MARPIIASIGQDLTPFEQDLTVVRKGTVTLEDGYEIPGASITKEFNGVIVDRPSAQFVSQEQGVTFSGDAQMIVRDDEDVTLAPEDEIIDEDGNTWKIEEERNYNAQFGVTLWILSRKR